jgi:dihydroorotate dehydrogenase
LVERAGLAVLHRLDPERAHHLSLLALRAGLAPAPGPVTSDCLRTRFGSLDLPNPLGLAAGFDKNAVAIGPLCRAGFGFVEVGAATPLPQPGNPRPRLFRLAQDRAAINRFGFNNDGAQAIAARLARYRRGNVLVGVNLGANKTSTDRAADFARVLSACGPHVDFATVNVSSPNTERLRDLQGPAALASLLDGVMAARDALPRRIPVWLKISPDLAPDDLAALAETSVAAGVDAIVATNTTLARDALHSGHRGQAGGLSGAPLFERSTRVLAQLHALTQGRIPLIGVGGVGSAEQAWEKIRAGASAVQLYTALAYSGLSLVGRIAAGLEAIARKQGFARVSDATGAGRGAWL